MEANNTGSMGDKLSIYYLLDMFHCPIEILVLNLHFDLGLLINCFYLNKCFCFSIVFFFQTIDIKTSFVTPQNLRVPLTIVNLRKPMCLIS